MKKHCLIVRTQGGRIKRSKEYLDSFMTILLILSFAVSGIQREACTEKKGGLPKYPIDRRNVPESGSGALNAPGDFNEFRKRAWDLLMNDCRNKNSTKSLTSSVN
jgi:hypothetical protein